MELYFAPFACSLASHIAAREAGIALDLRQVALATKRLSDGGDYLAVSPKGYVPTLRLDDGSIMTENPVILQYLADRKPESGLLPPVGSRERYEVLEWVGYVSTEIHKGIYALIFSPASPEEAKAYGRSLAERKFPILAERLQGRDFVAGNRFTIADAYLTWALTIAPYAGIDLAAWPALVAYRDRMQARPNVQAAIAYEQERAAA